MREVSNVGKHGELIVCGRLVWWTCMGKGCCRQLGAWSSMVSSSVAVEQRRGKRQKHGIQVGSMGSPMLEASVGSSCAWDQLAMCPKARSSVMQLAWLSAGSMKEIGHANSRELGQVRDGSARCSFGQACRLGPWWMGWHGPSFKEMGLGCKEWA